MDLLTKLYIKILVRTQKNMQEAVREALDELARDALNPRLAEMMKGLGIDPSRLSGVDASYAVLGLSRDCSDDEVKQNYLKIISQIHPDRRGPEMTFLASLVNTAYEAICKERGIS